MTPKLPHIRRWTIRPSLLCAAACAALLAVPAGSSAAVPPIKHVFVLIDENESASTTFGAGSPAPYLSQTLVSQGAYLSNYDGIGHSSLDNYIAMVSGQAPNPLTSGDCTTFADFSAPASMDASGQENGEGCVYPADVPTLMSQFDGAGLRWRAYEDSMGSDPTRESATCGHPAVGSPDNTESETALDQYATRHDPFVYFHGVIDNAAKCDANVVNLNQLPTDLKSTATTPNYVFITPSLCDDGHDATCNNGGAGGLGQADTFLRTWVPKITSSPAYQQDGLLIITFDESVGDDTACCGEVPGPYDQAHGIQPGSGGPGGGVVGAVLLSPYIAPGTKSATPYNHYSMLGSVEDLFGVPRLAAARGTVAFGSDVFTRVPRDSALKLRPARWSHTHARTTISYVDSEAAITKLTVVERLAGYRRGNAACRSLKPGSKRPNHEKSCTVTKALGSFRHSDTKGSNRIVFNGKVHGHLLAPGSYVLDAVPTAGPVTGRRQTERFQVT